MLPGRASLRRDSSYCAWASSSGSSAGCRFVSFTVLGHEPETYEGAGFLGSLRRSCKSLKVQEGDLRPAPVSAVEQKHRAQGGLVIGSEVGTVLSGLSRSAGQPARVGEKPPWDWASDAPFCALVAHGSALSCPPPAGYSPRLPSLPLQPVRLLVCFGFSFPDLGRETQGTNQGRQGTRLVSLPFSQGGQSWLNSCK